MADTSRDATGKETSDVYARLERNEHRDREGTLFGLLAKPTIARTLSDVDDPLEGCDSAVKSITFGRVGDPAGTHTRERNQAVTMRAFGYIPDWPRWWMGSAPAVRDDGEDEGREVDE
jgi:hypothetical protein